MTLGQRLFCIEWTCVSLGLPSCVNRVFILLSAIIYVLLIKRSLEAYAVFVCVVEWHNMTALYIMVTLHGLIDRKSYNSCLAT